VRASVRAVRRNRGGAADERPRPIRMWRTPFGAETGSRARRIDSATGWSLPRQLGGPTEMPRPGAPTMDERRTPSHGLGGRGMVAARNLWELKDHRLVGFLGEPGSSPTEVRWACGGHGRREQDAEPDGRGSRAVGCGSESSWRGVRMRRLTRGPIRPLVVWARDIGGSWHDVAQPSGSPPARG
jgi:hypothetical protein